MVFIKVTLAFILAQLWCYGFGAFVGNELNPTEWTPMSKAMLLFFPIAVTSIAYVALWSNTAIELNALNEKELKRIKDA